MSSAKGSPEHESRSLRSVLKKDSSVDDSKEIKSILKPESQSLDPEISSDSSSGEDRPAPPPSRGVLGGEGGDPRVFLVGGVLGRIYCIFCRSRVVVNDAQRIFLSPPNPSQGAWGIGGRLRALYEGNAARGALSSRLEGKRGETCGVWFALS